MNIDDYQVWTRSTAVYPKEIALEYVILGLCNEVGEVAGKYKKVLRGDYELDESAIQKLKDELSDCAYYFVRVADELGIKASDILQHNYDKLESRKKRGVLKGDGDNR